MAQIAIIHLCFLASLPVGIAILVVALRRRPVLLLAAIPLSLAGMVGLVFLYYASPIDFLGAGGGLRLNTVVGDYTVSFVQRPGFDFYDSLFEVRRADGRSARLWIDADDSKCWFPRLISRGSRSFISSPISDTTIQTAYVDTAQGTLTVRSGTFALASLDFE